MARIACVVSIAAMTALTACKQSHGGSSDAATTADSSAVSDAAFDSALGDGAEAIADGDTNDAGSTQMLTGTFSCANATTKLTSGTATANAITAAATSTKTGSNNNAATFANGAAVSLVLSATTKAADTVTYDVENFLGNKVASGSVAVTTGATTISVACTGGAPGYYAVHAALKAAGVALPEVGSRPAALITFGVLPDFTSVLTPSAFPHLEDHRFGGQVPLDTALLLGATWLNQSLSIATLEPTSANTFTPNTMPPSSSTLSAAGRMPYWVLNGFPAWASSSGAATSAPDYPPTSLSYYEGFMERVGQQAAATHAAQYPTLKHNYYQPTWEPGSWTGGAAGMASLYQNAYEGLHKTDPNAVVLGITTCCLTSQVPAYDTYGAAGLWKYLDGISMHAYPHNYTTTPSTGPDTSPLVSTMQALRMLMVTNLPARAPMIVSEVSFGYPSAPSATYPDSATLDMHLAYTVQIHTMLLGEGADTTFFFYGADFPAEYGFGLYFNLDFVNSPYNPSPRSPKPSALGAAALARLLDHTTTIGAINGLPTGVTAYAFRDGSGRAITALWAWNDTFTGAATYALKVDAAGTDGHVVVSDVMGNLRSVPYANGSVTLALTEHPQYVISDDPSVLSAQARAPVGYDPTP